MSFLADLHIHSRFSRATSKALNAPHLAAWALCKGLHVLGTGDFTHPLWRAELREQLQFDEQTGFYRLKGQPEALPLLGDESIAPERLPYFVPQAEISSIYKRHGKVRKVHNIIFVPTLEDADRLSAALDKIGNLNADGRPILGLDSHDLLELVLETVPDGVLIPAHIWTPWFSLFGSRSGFDSMEECFADLSGHIFALETGLSSDPAMNRLVSQLDGYALISNSDAHSGANLGREANLFDGAPSYAGMFAALRTAARREDQGQLPCRFRGTLEFYPEEGKYHLDGHRNCGVCLSPEESLKLGDICPVCGKPLTVGVLHRVMALADRSEEPDLPAEPEARSLIPLPEVVGELLGAGTGSQKVQTRYGQLLHKLGPELDILCSLPVNEIAKEWDELGEAVSRLRTGKVIRNGGYDGEYGTIRLFADGELPDRRTRLPGLATRAGNAAITARKKGKTEASGKTAPSIASLPLFAAERARADTSTPTSLGTASENTALRASADGLTFSYSEAQQAALQDGPHPVLVLAGPGAGKTRVLIGRLTHLLTSCVNPRDIVALTFTQRAAREMRERLAAALPNQADLPACQTLHAYAYALLLQEQPQASLLSDEQARLMFHKANAELSKGEANRLFAGMQLAQERCESVEDATLAACINRYAALKNTFQATRCFDFNDLLLWLRSNATSLPHSPLHLAIDEIQDLTPLQFAIVKALLPPDGNGFFGIGDPDQSIYGFRGAMGLNREMLASWWPTLAVHRLHQSYRATQAVLDMSHQLLGRASHCGHLAATRHEGASLHEFDAPNALAESDWIARRISRLLGSGSHTLLDSKRTSRTDTDDSLDGQLTPGDIAILVRLRAQIPSIQQALARAGIPVAAPQSVLFLEDSMCASLLALCATALGIPFASEAGEEDDTISSLPEEWRSHLPAPHEMRAWLVEQPWAGPLQVESETFAALVRMWQKHGNWPDFFAALALMREGDFVRSRAEVVQVMTLHAAKGLEFKAVFLPGLEEGLLPMDRETLFGERSAAQAMHDDRSVDRDEERRLLYVGLTRASQGIFISHAHSRKLFGITLNLPPSSFLPEIRSFCRQTTLQRKANKSLQQGSLI